ncbi:hypothetical protein [Desulfitobacterium sp. PCE1]|uniref:hypothetical protein n=1 Tax=Desulfitobacterium sp. PCE1 TaxID=146907 RepID=UPI00035CEB9F|nr:hypothetical protein [Desulfitobacterium sp. PCE1]
MNAMRLPLPSYNPVKQCQGCSQYDENKVAAQILSYQLAYYLLKRYSGTWQVKKDEILLQLEGADSPMHFELHTGVLRYKTLRTSIVSRYSVDHGLNELAEDIIKDFALPNSHGDFQDSLFGLFVKLIEIFHARCGLRIAQCEKGQNLAGWELTLGDETLRGWISADGVAENRFGERYNLKKWFNLRPEKMAAYAFGFYRFCENYPSPIKHIK